MNETEADCLAFDAWRAGTPPDGGAFSPASLNGLIMASGLTIGAFARAIGRGVATVYRWRKGRSVPDGIVWEGIKSMGIALAFGGVAVRVIGGATYVQLPAKVAGDVVVTYE